jgi:predicted Fe-Mo cluster-binding NifX family protein
MEQHDTMKIAVSSQNTTQVTGHLGHCQKFWIYDVNNEVADIPASAKDLLQLNKTQSFHESSPKDPHPLDLVNVLISGSMGKGLARRLESKGIEPIITTETDPDTAVNAYLKGNLPIISVEEHAHNHGHDEGKNHDGDCECNKE